jgi:hypothetical protein
MSFFEKLFGKEIADRITPEADKEYNAFLNDALIKLNEANRSAMETHGFGTFDEWSLDQDERILRFMDELGAVRIETPVSIVGTFSEASGSWMWGWANQSLVPSIGSAAAAVRDYGVAKGISDFTEPKIACDEQEAWAMAAAAWTIIGGSGIYRAPTGAGYAFLLMGELTSYSG